jgi:hypothetical protein
MEIKAIDRMNLLVDISVAMSKYTNAGSNWRPGIQDYCTFHTLINLYEDDMSDDNLEYMWTKTPDEIMYHIIETNNGFTIDYGWDDLYDSLRDYVKANKFVIHVDDMSDEEYNQLIEGRKNDN